MSKLAAALGALLLLAGTYIVYINDEVLDPDAAGQRAADAIADDPDLRAAIAPKIDDALPDLPDLPIVGGVSTGSLEDALGDPAPAEAFGDAVAVAVEDLTSDNRPDPLEINLAQVATEAATGLSSTPLDIVTGQVSSLQIDLSRVDTLLDVLDLVASLEPVGMPLMIVGALLLLAAMLLAAGLGEGLLAVGVSVGVASCLGIAALLIGRTLLAGAFDDDVTREAVLATWNALGGDLMTTSIIAAVAGFAVAVGGWLLAGSGRRRGPIRDSDPPPPPPRRRTSRYDETVRPGRDPDATLPGGPYDETIPVRRPPPPPRREQSPPTRRRPPPPDDLPPDQDFGRRRYS